MNRRNRRSSDKSTALHLFLESQLAELDARSLRVTSTTGDIIAAVGDDAYADEWQATWTRRIEGMSLDFAASGGRTRDDIAFDVRRIMS